MVIIMKSKQVEYGGDREWKVARKSQLKESQTEDRQTDASPGEARAGTEGPHGCFCVHGGDPCPHTRSFTRLEERAPALYP